MIGKQSQSGAALLIVLLLLATLSVIAIGMTQTIRLSVAKSRASENVSQARWYALGAEILASEILERQAAATPGVDTQKEEWLRKTVTLPLDNGLITASLSDASVCFNINSLVAEGGGELKANEAAVARYRLLLQALGFDVVAQRALSDVAVDWLDTDSSSRPGGAEDPDYARLAQPYRTGNTLIADISELRALMWYTPEIYQFIRPFLCAHPTTQPAEINLNLVTEKTVPVLFAALEEVMTLEELVSLILGRSADGYTDITAFWTANLIESRNIQPEMIERTALHSRYIRLNAQINYNGAFIVLQSLLEVTQSGRVNVIARKFGSDL